MYTPTPYGRAWSTRTIAILLFMGVLCCSTINSFAYQATPTGQHSKPTSTALQGAESTSTTETDKEPMECTQSDTDAVDSEEDSYGRAQRSMYNQLNRQRESVRYQIIAAECCEPLARRMAEKYPDRFIFHPTKWGKFPDGTDNIEIGGFHNPQNVISGEKVLFLASFHSNDATLSQFQVMICLLQSFIESLTVVLPFSPVGTMERVTREGQVATAATYAHSKSSIHPVDWAC